MEAFTSFYFKINTERKKKCITLSILVVLEPWNSTQYNTVIYMTEQNSSYTLFHTFEELGTIY
jgi:hypothetical protein